MSKVPAVSTLTASPLRNRIQVQLKAPVQEVWALVGDHTKLPEYSAGISRAEIAEGGGRICYFHPMDGATEGLVQREVERWRASGVGYATSAEPGNPFGLKGDLSLVTVEPSAVGTLFTWSQYYDAEDLDAMRTSFDEGLADIANRLIGRFGGTLLDRWVDKPQ